MKSNKQNPKPAASAKPMTRASADKSHQSRVARSYVDIERESHERFSKAVNGYWNFLSNPFDNKPSRPVFYDGSYIGNTGLVTGRVKGVVTVGTGGVGFVMATLSRGPTSKLADAPVSFTGLTYAAASGIAYDTAAVGVSGASLVDAPYNSTENALELVWRPVAGALRITPRGSMTNQDGVISFTEIPAHSNLYDTTTSNSISFNLLLSHPRTKVVRGAQLGDPSVVNQINWHPQASIYKTQSNSGHSAYVANDVEFRSFNSANTTRQFGEIIVGIEATAGTVFEFEFIASWETRGSKATGLRPSIQDAHASAIIFNTLCRQRVSGLIGKPREFTRNYHAALIDSVKHTTSHARDWLEVGKDVAAIAKEVAGFIL